MGNIAKVSILIASISDISECLPLFFWLKYGRKDGAYGILGIFFLISAILKITSLVTAELGIYNMPIYHALACLQIVMVYAFYAKLRGDRLSYSIIGMLVMFNLFNSFWLQDLAQFNSIAWSVNMLVLLAIGLLYLFRIYNNDQDHSPLESRPDFIITTAWLLYASGSLFTYLMSTDILSGQPEGFFNNAWMLESISNIVKNLIISYGIWLTRKAFQK